MHKTDFKKSLKSLYAPTAKDFELIDVPAMRFIMVDGAGAPGNETYQTALAWLYPLSYALKFHSKRELQRDYVVPPLEGLWWADDLSAYTERRKEEWLWTMMIMQPDWLTDEMFRTALDKTQAKLGPPPDSLRFGTYDEGLCVQILHIGSYESEAPTIARMHDRFLPQNGLKETGNHHEIYLSDPRRVAPEKLKTILRQPVARIAP